jgi:hypothetical protein
MVEIATSPIGAQTVIPEEICAKEYKQHRHICIRTMFFFICLLASQND